jgi:hypothetical protein
MLELHPNDNAREGRPSVWIFSGRLVILPVIGVAAFVALFRILDSAGVDWWLNILISLAPFAGMALYVWLFLKDKAPSYGQDVLGLWAFRFKQWLYLYGVFDRPPQFWVRQGRLPTPGEFREESK